MAKTTAWLVTVLGVLLVLVAAGWVALTDAWFQWVLALIVLVIGITKLVRNYSSKRK